MAPARPERDVSPAWYNRIVDAADADIASRQFSEVVASRTWARWQACNILVLSPSSRAPALSLLTQTGDATGLVLEEAIDQWPTALPEGSAASAQAAARVVAARATNAGYCAGRLVLGTDHDQVVWAEGDDIEEVAQRIDDRVVAMDFGRLAEDALDGSAPLRARSSGSGPVRPATTPSTTSSASAVAFDKGLAVALVEHDLTHDTTVRPT